jgi:phage terminase large subunit-like protein
VFEPAKGKGSMNVALVVGPANAKTHRADHTGIAAIGQATDENWYLLDAVRDRLSLRERLKCVMDLGERVRLIGVPAAEATTPLPPEAEVTH